MQNGRIKEKKQLAKLKLRGFVFVFFRRTGGDKNSEACVSMQKEKRILSSENANRQGYDVNTMLCLRRKNFSDIFGTTNDRLLNRLIIVVVRR